MEKLGNVTHMDSKQPPEKGSICTYGVRFNFANVCNGDLFASCGPASNTLCELSAKS